MITPQDIDKLKKIFLEKGQKISQIVTSVISWANITGKPSTFTPSAHTHPTSDITGLNEGLLGTKEVDETNLADNKILVYKTGSGKYELENKPAGSGALNKYDATADPTANDDSGDGYEVGSVWINIADDKIFQCVDATLGSAIWIELTNAVKLSGNQTVAGIKTFSSFPVTPSSDPSNDYEVANKKYVDDNLGGSNFALVMKTADTTINNNAVATDDPHLVVSFPSAGNYTIRGCLYGYERANSDFKFRLNFTGTLTSSRVMRLTAIAGATSLSTNVASANSNLLVSGSGTGMFSVFFEAILIVSTSGTFSIQWSQDSAVAEDTTLYAGSYFQWIKA